MDRDPIRSCILQTGQCRTASEAPGWKHLEPDHAACLELPGLLSQGVSQADSCWYRTDVLSTYDPFLPCKRKAADSVTEFGGVNALIYYSPSLFEGMGLDYKMQLDMSGVVNICQMVACFWSLWGMDRFGRRPLLFGGATCMVISHLIIAVLMSQFKDSWPSHTAEAWTCVAFLCFFMLTYGATWGPIPWAMPAEIFPSSLRAKGVAYSTMSNWLNNFIVGLITPPLIQNTGYGTYVFFCVFCTLSLIWSWFFVPETNGRTLEEMDYVFKDNTGADEQARRSRIEADIALGISTNNGVSANTA